MECTFPEISLLKKRSDEIFCKCRPGLVRERVIGDPERQGSECCLSKWLSAL